MNLYQGKNFKLLFNNEKDVSKYLCPNIFNFNNKTIFSCSVRYRKKKNYSEIRGYEINLGNLKLKKKIFVLKPSNYFINERYTSFLSPSIFKCDKKFFCLIQASKSNDASTTIILLQSNDLKHWQESDIQPFRKKKGLFSPYFFSHKKKKFIFYSKNLKNISCNIYNSQLRKKIRKIEIYKNIDFKGYIYAPNVIKIDKYFYMFFAKWKNKNTGNLEILKSQDLFKWKKISNGHLLNLNQQIKIVSEPCIIKYKFYHILLFECKLTSTWNIGYIKIKNINYSKAYLKN
jgi:sucrose-6-phosphate hydrolase SacC (GH32 family)